MKTPKVFGIGFQKTGTTSLEAILTRLGYKVAGYHQFRALAAREGVTMDEVAAHALSLLSEFDAAKDTPWPLLYRELDGACPGAKFIHVTRDPNAWIKSVIGDFGSHPNPLHTAIYGSPYPKGNEAAWLARYEAHNAEVAAYFADRPADYLHIHLEDGVTFEKVCPFLGAPLVARGAPKANTRLKKRLKMLWWRMSGRT